MFKVTSSSQGAWLSHAVVEKTKFAKAKLRKSVLKAERYILLSNIKGYMEKGRKEK